MPKIEFRENKTLKLVNVLSRKIPEKEFFFQDKQIQMVMNWVKARGYETQGPLVIFSSGVTGVNPEGAPVIDSRVMIQLKQNTVRLEAPYRFDNEIRIENCMLARFNDSAEKLQFATMKLQLFAYENDIELTGETYTILIKQKENILLADVFMPVKEKESQEEN